MSDAKTEQPEVTDLSNPDVSTKYRLAADITNEALTKVKDACVAGAKIVDICDLGDKFILERTSTLFKKGSVSKGIAFPTSISVNHVVGHNSPLATDETVLAEGDMVKIDLGVQLGGYCAPVAHTIVIGGATGRKADVLAAASTAAAAAIRLLNPGSTNTKITEAIAASAKSFGCEPVVGVLSHRMDKNTIDVDDVILNKTDDDNKTRVVEFEANHVYCIDIVMSTGSGKPTQKEQNTTIYKRDSEKNYSLKMKSSRALFSEIKTKFPSFPFTIRSLEGRGVNLGITECQQHGLVEPYPVLYEKEGEFVAHFKYTVLITANSTSKITGLEVDRSAIATDKQVTDDELQAVLDRKIRSKKKRAKKKKKKTASA